MATHKAPFRDLIENCLLLKQSIRDARDWTQANLPPEKQKAFTDVLEDYHRLLSRYESAAHKRPSVALFGPSQVGKSFLATNLCATPESGDAYVLDTRTGNHYNCRTEINPGGGGKESTGLVTRFTTDSPPGAPFSKSVRLKLLSQADLVKVIADGYLCDLATWDYAIDRERILEKLRELKSRCQPVAAPEFSRDEVFEIRDYLATLERYYGTNPLIRDLRVINYWDALADLVPYLPYRTRTEALAFIWGEHAFFNDLFNTLSDGLNGLRFEREVAVDYESALVPRELSIIDVERWAEILLPESDLAEKYARRKSPMPASPTQLEVELSGGQRVRMNRSVLSGLGSELTLHLPAAVADHPQRRFLREADCLDFPGARNRLEIDERGLRTDPDKQLQVFLRGKVSYLFNRYDLNLEISTFVLCLGDAQMENPSLVKLAYNWIRNNVGTSAEAREAFEARLRGLTGEKATPFMVVFTMFNKTLEKQPNNDVPGRPETYGQRWLSRLDANFVSYFSKLKPSADNWIRDWNQSDRTFKNAFFLRDPLYSEQLYEGNYSVTRKETGIRPDYRQAMQDTEQSFVTDEQVAMLFRHPQEAWNETTLPNKSGIDYIIQHLTPTSNPVIKYAQVRELIGRLRSDLKKHLETQCVSEDEQERTRKARVNAARVVSRLTALNVTRQSFGFFLENLMLSEKTAWSIYFKMVNGSVREQVPKAKPVTTAAGKVSLHQYARGLGLEVEGSEEATVILQALLASVFVGLSHQELIPILDGDEVDWREAQRVEEKDDVDVFAEKLVYEGWGGLLNDFRRTAESSWIGINAETLDLVTEHLQKNADKINLAGRIARVVRPEFRAYHPVNNPNFDLVARLSTAIVNEYVLNAGEESTAYEHRTPLTAPQKSELSLDTPYPGKRLFENWQNGYRQSSERYALGKFATIEQVYAQEQLRRIIQQIPLED